MFQLCLNILVKDWFLKFEKLRTHENVYGPVGTFHAIRLVYQFLLGAGVINTL